MLLCVPLNAILAPGYVNGRGDAGTLVPTADDGGDIDEERDTKTVLGKTFVVHKYLLVRKSNTFPLPKRIKRGIKHWREKANITRAVLGN